MSKRKKILIVAGARPNFMKVAPLLRAMQKQRILQPFLVHTGQHYDYTLSQSFFKDHRIPRPSYFLRVGSGSHAVQTAKTMVRFEKLCTGEKPDCVVVVGDVNSTLACALSAKKLSIPVAHVEAGLRSFDKSMPEELNRRITDGISDFLFVSESSGVVNLNREGIEPSRVFLVGNTMIDSLQFGLERLRKSPIAGGPLRRMKESAGKYGVVTLHRPNNVDKKNSLKKIIGILNGISRKLPLFFPVHPRTQKMLKLFKLECFARIHLLPPLSYLEFLYLFRDAAAVLTDSGGIQEEATFLKIPCLTLRENTERPITVTRGTNTVVGLDREKIRAGIDAIIAGKYKKGSSPEFWDGKASERIVKILAETL